MKADILGDYLTGSYSQIIYFRTIKLNENSFGKLGPNLKKKKQNPKHRGSQ